MPFAIIEHACPNCGNAISAERLNLGLPCDSCLPSSLLDLNEYLNLANKRRHVFKTLSSLGRLKHYKSIYEIEQETKEFISFFEKILGRKPWSAQRTWAKRLIRGESFAIIAPTGIGKTTFSAIYGLFHVITNRGKVYFIVPTKTLLKQVYENILNYVKKISSREIKVLALGLSTTKKIKENDSYILEIGDFDILLSTSAQLTRNFEKIGKHSFTLIIIDDVDALLRNSKNIDRVLKLIGFSDDIIECAYKLVIGKIDFFKLILSNAPQERIDMFKEKLREYREKIAKYIAENRVGQIVVCSATGRSKGLKSKIFRELLQFEAGTVIEYMRNIVDVYDDLRENFVEQIAELIRKLGKGGLIYVSQDLGIHTARKLVRELKEKGFKVELASSNKRGFIEKFIEEKIDVLIGVASYYGVIVRGLDIPDRIRYAIFLGVPKFQIELKKSINNPLKMLSILMVIENFIEDQEELIMVKRYAKMLSKIIDRISYRELRFLRKALSDNMMLDGYLGNVLKILKKIRDYIVVKVDEENIKRKLKETELVLLREIEGKLFIVAPDVMTYIQASGRTSRMFANGMTKGLSVLLIDDDKVFKALIRQLKFYVDNFEIKPLNEVNIQEILNEIDRDRDFVRKIMTGEIATEYKDPMISALLVVESPTKAKTIASFFGKPSKRRINGRVVYEVVVGDPILGTKDYMLSIIATGGHILDVVTDYAKGFHGVMVNDEVTPIYAPIKRCRSCGYQFVMESNTCPRCNSINIKCSCEIIDVLRKLAQEVEVVFIGTDPDSEGEKIAWDVYVILRPYIESIWRVEFHEITRKAIINAIANPRKIKESLVEAQIVRRVEDRWIGFELSRRLWNVFGKHWLSAGRVQTPVLGWIIKQYKKWKSTRKLFAEYILEKGISLKFYYDLYFDKRMIEEYAKNGALILIKTSVIEKINPPPPYTTNSVLYDLSVKYKIDSRYAMKILQDLFESGFITYHRTDSVRVSNNGIEIAKMYLEEKFNNKEIFKPRYWSSSGAHECIRPTRPYDADTLRKLIISGNLKTYSNLTYNHFRVYDLIFRRFIASQMKPAIVEKTRLTIKIGEDIKIYEFISKIIEKGFLKMLQVSVNTTLANIAQGLRLKIQSYKIWKGSLEPLFKQGDVIKLMKEQGIGRPSTYAKIIDSIIRHGYVIESKNKYLIPTTIGKNVYQYLITNFNPLVSEDTTRNLEKLMHMVEEGKINYVTILKDLYLELKTLVKESITMEKAEAGVS